MTIDQKNINERFYELMFKSLKVQCEFARKIENRRIELNKYLFPLSSKRSERKD